MAANRDSVVNDYDAFAEAYTAANEDGLINAHYARPAILDLVGDVTARRVLDAGCGSGPLSAAWSPPQRPLDSGRGPDGVRRHRRPRASPGS
ncbi:hypothetical protein LY13_000224 [Prauserella aidingensis]|nr:hypothetical protein [Prauserella aidingensis]